MKQINQLKTKEEVAKYYKEHEEKLKKVFANFLMSCIEDIIRLREKCGDRLKEIEK